MTNNWRVEDGPIDTEALEPDVVTLPLHAYTEGQKFPYRLFLTEIDQPQVRLHIFYLFRNPKAHARRFLKVYKFMVVKGYYNTGDPPLVAYRRRLHLEDLIWAGEEVDSRILAILPALLIRFPGHFTQIQKLPIQLANAVRSLRAGHAKGPSYRGFPYVLLKNWLDFVPRDQRSTIRQGHRLSVRLEPETTQALNQFVERTGLTTTEAIRRAIVNLTQSP